MRRLRSISWSRTEFYFESTERLLIPLFEQKLDVWVHPEADEITPNQLEALDQFLQLPSTQRGNITHHLALDCQYVCLESELDGADVPIDLKNRSDVWNYVEFDQVLIPHHKSSSDRYVFVSGNCSWEEEHGIELLFKNGRLFKVGREEGLSSNEEWDLFYINE